MLLHSLGVIGIYCWDSVLCDSRAEVEERVAFRASTMIFVKTSSKDVKTLFFFTFSEPCIVIHTLEKDQQDAHFSK